MQPATPRRGESLRSEGGTQASKRVHMAPPMSALVVCAMESEAVHLRRRLSDVEELVSPAPRAWRISKGVLHGADVRLLLCNIGEANAAGGTSAVLASGWRPDVVINYGCAGAHDAAIREGDVVSQTRSVSTPADNCCA